MYDSKLNHFKLVYCSILNSKDKIVCQLKLSSKFKSLLHFWKDVCGILFSTKAFKIPLYPFFVSKNVTNR